MPPNDILLVTRMQLSGPSYHKTEYKAPVVIVNSFVIYLNFLHYIPRSRKGI